MARIHICKEDGCHNAATTKGYCRLHYLRHWKNIKEGEKRHAAERLNKYVEYICRKHPDRYMEVIKEDLRSPTFEKDVERAIGDDESSEEEIIFDEPTYEEEIEKLIRELKIEKGF